MALGGGSAVGRALARNLEIAYYDRALIDKIIEETGVSHDLMKMADAGKDIKGKRENDGSHRLQTGCSSIFP